jgi:SAM-dependent methyltransferase
MLRVLEIGCGPGAQLWYLAHEGHRATGLDLSGVGLRQAQRRLQDEALPTTVDLVEGDARTLPFADERFDLVIEVEAFAHNHQNEQCVLWREAGRVLNADGVVASIGFTARTHGANTGRQLDTRTVTDIGVGPLRGVGLVSLRAASDGCADATGAGLHVAEAQLRSWTTGPEHWLVEESIVVARKPLV